MSINAILKKSAIPSKEEAIVGRKEAIKITGIHIITKDDMTRQPEKSEAMIVLGMGCFWGAERKLWNTKGVKVTAVGYAGGHTENPTYEETCTGQTGHSEVVKVIYDKTITSLEEVLQVFWENHDPTQGMKQGNDIGSQYRSVIYTTSPDQTEIVEKSVASYQQRLIDAGMSMITTEREPLDTFYYAEEYHQQYLHKNPTGYCGLSGTGVSCPIGLSV
ncbi:peptide-methionine (S)-S-oxide reductase MsrA [Marinomonas sp. 15G1-11]|uniref:Peptide methionine sulfoxide reductase MsrA n=1 Tax=Marinomonas phaeophyticola TaxID=3004091 RepID=A0ABT4JQS1_9GAMM|nr:peptide-methionine (S)-S-oxide reductase MsrA [Marinomonas sp. 15G1-11]MCZ2720730.1 peptide-methionine (S)-S-oxide reductase MsrA [Marinomonas sp. 15G1-11]